MMVLVLYEPDEECLDPLDDAKKGRRHVDTIEDDVLVVWRETHGDPDGDGHDAWHIAAMGIFQNVTPDEVKAAIEQLGHDA